MSTPSVFSELYEPEVPEPQRGTGSLTLRYEDVTQDGRMVLAPMTHMIGAAIWRDTLRTHPIAEVMRKSAILPILSRLQIEAGRGPIAVHHPVSARGSFDVVKVIDPAAPERTRMRIDMFVEGSAPLGRTYFPPPDGAGEPIVVGRVSAQNTLTRPFAPKEERAVTELPEGHGAVVHEVEAEAPISAMKLPPGAQAIDEAFAMDPTAIAFGIGHTDSNQHVNSLVYPRLIEDAALRRFHQLGIGQSVYARFLDIAFRKPCFAGDRMRLLLRAFRLGEEVGVVAALIPTSEAIGVVTPSERAHCFARMQFVP